MRGLARYVEDLLRHGRPRRFRAGAEDEAVLRTAITLRAARPGSGVPREEFVTGLAARLAGELDPGSSSSPSSSSPSSSSPSSPARPAGPAGPARWRGASRRQFVQGASVAAAAAALGAGVDHVIESRGGGSPHASPTLVSNAGAWRTVATSQELAENAVRPFDLGTVVGFVTRTDGEVRAVSGICTHQSCRLALEPATRQLTCPCHNAAFALTGQVVRHELRAAPTPLPHLLAREVDGAVQVFAPATSGR